MEARGNELKGWCATVVASRTVEQIKETLANIATRWIFQEEKGAMGFRHYQCTFELKVKARKHAVLLMWPNSREVHLSPISAKGKKGGAWDYCEKKDTRVAGPWKSDDSEEPAESKLVSDTPREFQKKIVDYVSEPYDVKRAREIMFVCDPKGNAGKSSLYKHLIYKKLCGHIRPGEAKEMIRAAYDQWAKHKYQAWVIDIPRQSIAERFTKSFWAGVETIKNGQYEDDRHTHKSEMVNNPKVILFCNDLPNIDMTEDRIVKWLVYNGKMVKYSKARHEAIKATIDLEKESKEQKEPDDEFELDVTQPSEFYVEEEEKEEKKEVKRKKASSSESSSTPIKKQKL